jgi:Raf kinase inhibitor-like YbhB/YbcL family protein
MILASPTFKNNEFIPDKYTCNGPNLNPPLTISSLPPNTQSLALIVDDPDAPLGIWTHWTVWNIDPKTTQIAENSVPATAVEGTTSWGKPGYSGPCPPSGTHRYFFKLFALDTSLSLDSSASLNQLNSALQGHIIGQAELVGKYSKK